MARRGWLPLVGNPAAAYTFVYIDDLVRAVLAAVDRRLRGEVIFLGHANPVASRELLETVRAASGGRARLVSVPKAITRIAALTGDLAGTLSGRPAVINTRRFRELYSVGFVCRVTRMAERLGVSADVGLREGLARAAGWYQGL
jgi:nucleoside-diphosphate-sugar epimerase